MKIIAVVGTGSGCGKTTAACRILRAILNLGAVKISPHDGPSKDTDLYAGCGADPVARIVGPRDAVGSAWELIRGQFKECRGVVIEGACALSIPEKQFVVFVAGEPRVDLRGERNSEFFRNDIRTFLSGPEHE